MPKFRLIRLKKFTAVVLLFSVILSTLPLDWAASLVSDFFIKSNIVDKAYLSSNDSNVVDKFIPLSRELADQFQTKAAQGALDPARLEYHIFIGPVAGSASASYNYVSIFNPSGSTKTVAIKKLMIQTNATTTATYQDFRVRRISAASAGASTQIAPANIPKKNSASANSVLEIRYANPTVTFSGSNSSTLMAVVGPGSAGAANGMKEIIFASTSEKLILQPGEGIVLGQVAAGDTDQKVRLNAEWEETSSPPASQGEYMIAYPTVANAAAADYKYATFFNPAASGKTAVIKHLWLDVDASGAAVYTNNIYVRRISAASAGTQILPADAPKMNTSTANSVMDMRYLGVTATLVGANATSSEIMSVMPAGAVGQMQGHQEIDFKSGDEKLILQPGEGIAVVSSAVGNANQLVRFSVEWGEVAVASTPASQGEYMISVGPLTGSTTAYNFASFYNPAASGKTAVIKRLSVRVNAAAAAAYVPMFVQRITAASAGASIVSSSIPKMNTSTPNSVMDVRSNNPTITLAGTDGVATVMGLTSPGAVGQTIGLQETVFDTNEKLVLQPGEGIVLRQNVAGNVNHQVRFLIEWGEVASPPASQGEYLSAIGPVTGSASANYTYATFMNPVTSTKTAVIKRIATRIDAIGAAVYIPVTVRRITTSTAGTVMVASDIVKKHSGSATSSMVLRYANGTVGVTYYGSTNSRLDAVMTPGAVAAATSLQTTGNNELTFTQDEPIVLRPGEGIGMYQEAVGSANLRVRFIIEWGEVVSPPATQNELMISSPLVAGSLTSGYVYASFFNPVTSSQNYVVKRLGVRALRSGAASNPTSMALTARRIVTTVSGGTFVTSTPAKNTQTPTSTIDLRYGGSTVTFAGVSSTISVTVPNAVGQSTGSYETFLASGDEMILAPGEGIAIYQESNAGDVNVKFVFKMEWSETAATPGTLTVGVTAGSQTPYLNSGTVGQFVDASSTCNSAANCSLFTVSSTYAVLLSSIKVSEIGTVNASTSMSNLDLYYDTTGTNGTKTLFGTANFNSSEIATVTGTLVMAAGTPYYFYAQVDLINGANDPAGGQVFDIQIANNADVVFAGNATAGGAPASLVGSTTIRPVVTGYTNSIEPALNYVASCASCGARIGPSSTFKSQTINITGYGFGANPGVGAKDTTTTSVKIGTHLIGDVSSTMSNIPVWNDRSITFYTDTAVTGDDDTSWGVNYGGVGALSVVSGGQTVSTTLNFYVLPQITQAPTINAGLPPGDNAREYNNVDADGVISLNGTRFGTAATGGWVRILGCDASTCSSPSGSVTTTAWGNSLITVQVPTVIADNSYTGSIILQQGVGANSLTTTYSNPFRVLPRITTTTPNSGPATTAVTFSGDHLCQTGVCPGAFSSTSSVGFYNNVNATTWTSWSDTSIVTAVPTGAATGNVVVTSSIYASNVLSFTVSNPTPSDPTSLNQYYTVGLTNIVPSSTIGLASTTPLYLTMTMQAPTSGGTTTPQIELQPFGTSFACTGAVACGTATEGAGKVGTGSFDCSNPATGCAISITPNAGGLPAGQQYHWQARVKFILGGSNYYSNWLTFNGNGDGIAFKFDNIAPAITSVASSAITSSTATISWLTSGEPSTSQVQYNLSGTFGQNCAGDCTTLDSTTTYSHSVTLSGLTANTTYYYRVRSIDAAGNESISGPNTFTTDSGIIAPTGFPATGDLISAVFDTAVSSAAYNSIMWKGTLPANTKVRLQLATSNCPGGQGNPPACNDAATWESSFVGSNGVSCGSVYFYELQPDTPAEIKCVTQQNKRYFKYKIELCSDSGSNCEGNGADTPIVNSVIVNWSP